MRVDLSRAPDKGSGFIGLIGFIGFIGLIGFILGGSWVVISGVISPLSRVISIVRGVINPPYNYP